MGILSDRSRVAACFERCSFGHHRIAIGADADIFVTSLGGRILGPFWSDTGASTGWLADCWRSPQALSALVEEGGWNLGGERMWISPEIQYNVRDRRDFWGTIELSPQMEPGTWALEALDERTARLSQQCELEAFNLAAGTKRLSIERRIRPAADPLRGPSGLRCCGYEEEVTISEDRRDDIMSETWLIAQLPAGGTMIVPSTRPGRFTNYFERAPRELISASPGGDRAGVDLIRTTGRHRFKLGFKSAATFGRIGYLFPSADAGSVSSEATLVVRNFYNNPSVPYVEEPPAEPGNNGHSIHVYNDGGELGGFCELECMGQTIGGETGVSTRTERFQLWFYRGPRRAVEEAAQTLLGWGA